MECEGYSHESKGPRTLLVDANYRYVNPTRNLLPALLSAVGPSERFGPGYCTESDLRAGLKDYIRRRGPFDFVVCTSLVGFSTLLGPDRMKRGTAHQVFAPVPRELAYDLRPMWESFLEVDGLRAIALIETDYYNLTEAHLNLIERSGSIALGWGEELCAPLAELPFVVEEEFAARANNRWTNYVRTNRHKVLSTPAFIADNEFSWTPLAHRRQTWSVPGATYSARREARLALRRMGEPVGGVWPNRILAATARLKLRPFARNWSLNLINQYFRSSIEDSQFVYTCGSGLNYPVRKYFEVPALGSVLVCRPCSGFEALGFRSGVNAVIAEPSELFQIGRDFESDPEAAGQIASAGREMVWRLHRLEARAEQIRTGLEAALRGDFRGSAWIGGKFVLR